MNIENGIHADTSFCYHKDLRNCNLQLCVQLWYNWITLRAKRVVHYLLNLFTVMKRVYVCSVNAAEIYAAVDSVSRRRGSYFYRINFPEL
jgi:hypothetical protein